MDGWIVCICVCELLYSLSKAISAVWDYQSGSAGNHSVVIIKEMLLQHTKTTSHYWCHIYFTSITFLLCVMFHLSKLIRLKIREQGSGASLKRTTRDFPAAVSSQCAVMLLFDMHIVHVLTLTETREKLDGERVALSLQ